VRTKNQYLRELVHLAVLGLLLEREYHGYDLKRSIDRRMGEWTDIRAESIYYAIAKLEEAGFIKRFARTGTTVNLPAPSIL